MRFSDFPLDPRLQRAVTDAGYTLPTAIQLKAIPYCMEGDDLIGTAATGTGKTAAFVLPLLHRLMKNPAHFRAPRALIVTPTRELAEQIKDVIRELGRHTHMRSAVVYGGVGFDPQRRALSDGTEIIVACPGRLLDHMGRWPVNLKHIETVVLDEADRMLDMGFLPDIKRILDALPVERQTLLFSATFAPELTALIKNYLKMPKRVSVNTEAPAETVDHCFYPVPPHLKTALLLEILKTMEHKSILIFTRTKHRANRIMEALAKTGYKTGVLHSNKSQNQRKAALDGFRDGKIEILVATDIAARGLDIESISHVINYDIPDTATNYIHRIGRTGRATRSGDAFTLITPEDGAEVRDIERRLGYKVEMKKVNSFDYSQASKERNEFARPPRPQHGHRPHHAGPSRPAYHQGLAGSSHRPHPHPANKPKPANPYYHPADAAKPAAGSHGQHAGPQKPAPHSGHKPHPHKPNHGPGNRGQKGSWERRRFER